MRFKPTPVAVACTLFVVSSAMLASPEQTRTPGEMTQARVWVENRGRSEALPVDLRDVNLDQPLRVQVINAEPQYGSTGPVQVRPVRQAWEYRSVTVPPADDLATTLNVLGSAGWETTGIASVKGDETTMVLKRLRQP
jgi:hypothetical protein